MWSRRPSRIPLFFFWAIFVGSCQPRDRAEELASGAEAATSSVKGPAVDCRTIPGLSEVLTPGRIVLLGEMHGTREAPAFLYDAVCLALFDGLAVTVGLELPATEQPSLNRYLMSNGSDDEEAMLLAEPFWRRQDQDGRNSQSILDLIEGFRVLSTSSAALRLFFIDDPTSPDRDISMARAIAGLSEHRPEDLIFILTGNLHSRIDAGSGWMGSKILPEVGRDRLVSLVMRYSTGSAWVCLAGETCGVQTLQGNGEEGRWEVRMEPSEKYDGVFAVGEITASRPAR